MQLATFNPFVFQAGDVKHGCAICGREEVTNAIFSGDKFSYLSIAVVEKPNPTGSSYHLAIYCEEHKPKEG